MPNDTMIGFAFIGILVLSLVMIVGISGVLSLCVSNDRDERGYFRWLFVSVLFALCIALWALIQ